MTIQSVWNEQYKAWPVFSYRFYPKNKQFVYENCGADDMPLKIDKYHFIDHLVPHQQAIISKFNENNIQKILIGNTDTSSIFAYKWNVDEHDG